jgi:signal transduction histidine kinase
VIAGLIYNIRRRKRAEGALKATLADQSRQIEKAVEKSRHQADVIADQQRHQALSELLINLAHQWRQPLNAAGVLIKDIEDAYLAGELNETIIRRQSALAFSQLKSLSKTLDRFTALYEDPGQKEQLSLIALYHEARELMALRLKAQGVQIQGEIDPGHTVCMARRDLLEVLIKLITNAIETAQKRHLTQLKIVIESKQAENLTTIVLTDSAGGIEPEALSKLFDPYHTTGFKERSRGLSLYLIRRMIERRYEGSITAENSDKGARITLTLPSRCGN